MPQTSIAVTSIDATAKRVTNERTNETKRNESQGLKGASLSPGRPLVRHPCAHLPHGACAAAAKLDSPRLDLAHRYFFFSFSFSFRSFVRSFAVYYYFLSKNKQQQQQHITEPWGDCGMWCTRVQVKPSSSSSSSSSSMSTYTLRQSLPTA